VRLGGSFRRFVPFLLLLLSCIPATAQDTPDPVLGTVPFERWMTGGDHTQIPWKMTLSTPMLDNHQRLRVTISIFVEGKELAKRPHGQLRMLVQFNDEQGGTYEDHGILELKDVTAPIKSSGFYYTHDAFVRPGDYRVGVAIVDTATREHSFARRNLHVEELKDDPLALSWNALSPVEILSHEEAPESWYLPYVRGRLYLPLSTARPMRVEVLMNLPAEDASAKLYRNAMSALLPAFKALFQIGGQSALLEAVVLDLTRQRVSFEQSQGRDLDWPSLKTALGLANPNVIDVHSLSSRGKSVDFFLSEVRRRIETGSKWRADVTRQSAADPGESPAKVRDPQQAVIVLSSPMMFAKGTDMHPIQLEDSPDCPVFYIRYHTPLERRVVSYMVPTAPPIPTRGSGGRGGRAQGPEQSTTPTTVTTVDPFAPEEADALENTLKPLRPRLFDVTTPDQFRKALAAILDEIGRS
jgi:hypothetical protein